MWQRWSCGTYSAAWPGCNWHTRFHLVTVHNSLAAMRGRGAGAVKAALPGSALGQQRPEGGGVYVGCIPAFCQ
jgi:hypothetical protein